MKYLLSYFLLMSWGISFCQIERLELPEGMEANVFAKVPKARSLCQSPSGIVYVGTRAGNQIHALKDTDGDGVADRKWVVANGLSNMPNGVAFKDGNLYIAEVDKVWVLKGIESQLDNPPEKEIVYGGYPKDRHHGWKYIAFGPDGWLYIPVGGPCNICLSEDPVYASITRLNVETKEIEIVAKGVRNTVGFTWHPITRELWFTDNGRDHLGDNLPPDELNRMAQKGDHFGYPFCHGGYIKDPEYGNQRSCNEFISPIQNLGPHVAALGLKFVPEGFPIEELQGDVLIAEHGSWNRSEPIGYRVSRVNIKDGRSLGYETLIQGWLDENGDVWGRPVDILFLEDKSFLVSDDLGGTILRFKVKE